MSTKPVRVAVIGCGGNGKGHIRQLVSLPDVDLVGCVDIRPQAIDEVKAIIAGTEHKPEFFSYHEDMLEKVHPDAVVISTPHSLHYSQARDSLQGGAHVLLEKPMTGSVDNARELVGLAERLKLTFAVSYQRHGMGKYRYARDVFKSQALGDVYFIQGFLSQCWLIHQEGKWRTDPEMSGGGQINDSGSHLLDILLWITGLRPREVFAYVKEYKRGVDIVASLNMTMENGALANIAILGLSPRGPMWEELTFYGTSGALLFRDNILLWKDEEGRPKPVTDFPENVSPDANFIDAVLGRAEVNAPGSCGVAVAELTQAIYESAHTHAPVAVAGE